MNQLHKKSSLSVTSKEPQPAGTPVKPKKPAPAQQESAKVPVPICLSEERVREIAREEIRKHLMDEVSLYATLNM